MARKVDEPWTKCRNSTDLDWTRAFAHDGRDPRTWPQTRLCRGQHCEPTRSVDQLCEMCTSLTLHSKTHCSNDVSVDAVIGFSAGGSETIVTPERQRLHSEASAQRNLDATNTSCLPDNSSLAPSCCEHPSDGTDQSTAGKCSDD